MSDKIYKGRKPAGKYAVIARLNSDGSVRVGTVDKTGNEVSLVLTRAEARDLAEVLFGAPYTPPRSVPSSALGDFEDLFAGLRGTRR